MDCAEIEANFELAGFAGNARQTFQLLAKQGCLFELAAALSRQLIEALSRSFPTFSN